MSDKKQLPKRALQEQAVRAALEAQWDDAIEINKEIVERSPKDAEAFNRLGRAHLALGQYDDARDAYGRALKADPANLIARRNLQRLDTRRRAGVSDAVADLGGDESGAVRTTTLPRTSVFIEVVGKTWVDELVNPAAAELLADIPPGEQLLLVIEGDRLSVHRSDNGEPGSLVGVIEAKTAERMIGLAERGNRYEVYALGLSGQSLRVILREVHHDPSLGNIVSFPRQITSRAYLRERDALRQRDEADFLFLDDDDEDEDDNISAVDAEEEESSEPEEERFVAESIPIPDDEESGM